MELLKMVPVTVTRGQVVSGGEWPCSREGRDWLHILNHRRLFPCSQHPCWAGSLGTPLPPATLCMASCCEDITIACPAPIFPPLDDTTLISSGSHLCILSHLFWFPKPKGWALISLKQLKYQKYWSKLLVWDWALKAVQGMQGDPAGGVRETESSSFLDCGVSTCELWNIYSHVATVRQDRGDSG